jgi:HAMP domain-containing protein
MKLLLKFNLILFALFGICGLLITNVAHQFLLDNARQQVEQQAELMMASARAVRDYTSGQLAPLLKKTPEHRKRFLPETVPAFGAQTTFAKLRASYPEYSYREATLNPTNLQDRAVDWESDIIRYLRDHRDSKEVTGERETPTGRSLYLARPMVVTPACMECHSTPDKAPAQMIRAYGNVNGFGWKLDDVIAAQIVTVPMSLPVQIADRAYRRLLIYLTVALVFNVVIFDIALYFLVLRPLKVVGDAADRVSRGDTGVPEVPVKGKDEIASITASFNRMRTSLVKALEMLDQV